MCVLSPLRATLSHLSKGTKGSQTQESVTVSGIRDWGRSLEPAQVQGPIVQSQEWLSQAGETESQVECKCQRKLRGHDIQFFWFTDGETEAQEG